MLFIVANVFGNGQLKSEEYVSTSTIKDGDKIYSNVISKACDSCIVLMYYIYNETIETTGNLLSKLSEIANGIVSVFKLDEIKDYNFESDDVTSFIK